MGRPLPFFKLTQPNPILFTVICRTCRGLASASQPAISTGTSPEVSPESTINPLSRQLGKSNLTLARSRVSFGSVLSSPTSSSQEDETTVYLPEEERKKINLDALNYALGVISEGKVQPIPHYLGLAWNTLSCAAKEEHTRNAVEAVSLVLRALAPSQEENLWEAVTESRQLSTGCAVKEDVALESILLAYRECINRATKTQILSLISDKYSQSELLELLPEISLRQIKNARKHAERVGRGEITTKEPIHRCRLDMKKVKGFIDFISRSTFLQDVAFGTKVLKLSSGESIVIPALVRTMTAAKIIHLYQDECAREDENALGERTCYQIIEVCSASKQKSLQGLDNTATAGTEAFELLESLVGQLSSNGAGAEWGRQTVKALRSGKMYLKGEYKSHLGPHEQCPDHCTVFALSDPHVSELSAACNHEHSLLCADCQNIKMVLEGIREKIEDEKLDLTHDQRERAMWENEDAVVEIEAWKTHLLRAFHQDLARLDALSSLDEETVIVINDWAMKFLPMRFRETQSQWFGKRGISWHFSAVIHMANHPDCQCTTTSMNGFKIHTYIVVLDSCKQDWFAVSCILEEVLSVVKASHPTVTQAKVRSDNAGCYHCTALLTTINNSSNRSGIEVKRYDFSEPQAGKDLCDRKIAPCKQRLRNYVSENHNIENAHDIKEGLESPPAMDCTRVAVCKIDPSKVCPSIANNKITGILKFNNFSYDEGGVRVWQAYGIGEGVYFDEFEAKQDVSGLERDGEWSAAVEKQRKQAKPKSNGSTRDPGSTYSCLDPACILTFDSIQDAEDHIDAGEHVFTPENEKIYDTVKRQWAAVSTTVKGKNEKIGEAAYGEGQGSGATKGWALKNRKLL